MSAEIPYRILDSWNKPVVFVDTGHVIRYMNRPARRHYAKWGNVVGKSIFDCHNPRSGKIIRQSFQQFLEGTREVLIVDSPKHRVFMRSVRDEKGLVIGYIERYDPPAATQKT